MGLLSNCVTLFILAVVGAALYLEPYKFGIMYERYFDHLPYWIFPWNNDQKSSSTPLWLIVHLASALTHLLLTAYMTLRYKRQLATLWSYSHTVFCILIMLNLEHFGQTPLFTAMAINGIPLMISILTFDKDNESWWKSYVYFFTISSPVILETIMYIRR